LLLTPVFAWAGITAGAAMVPFLPWIAAILAAGAAAKILYNVLFKDNVGASTGLEALGKQAAVLERTADGYKKVGTAINAIPDKKATEFATTTMNAATTSNIAAKTTASPAHAGGLTGADRPRTIEKVRQPISIDLRGEKLADFVVEVVGEKIHAVNFE